MHGPVAYLSLLTILPFVLLFQDYPGKRTYIAVRYLVAFTSMVFLLPFLIRSLGLWLPMAVPVLVFAYAYGTRRRR